ncbi:transglutaminase family protein [Methylotenera sp. 1P/1]|jgi:transglutaminase-like putative cysteine protease|nr:transglutaminase family protein [Methylotenera sp. 1P/1]
MRLNIQHQTQYVYSEMVTYTIQQLRLTPQNGFGQHVRHWDIKVNGQLHEVQDTFGNIAHTLVIDNPHHELYISVSGEVETGVGDVSQHEALPMPIYLRETELTAPSVGITEFAHAFKAKPLEEMMHALRDKMQYLKGATQVDTTAAQAFALGQGVCQDHAHVFIACCRSLGYPARYVSGYLFTEDGSLMQTHAWADVWLDDRWQSLDVSNGCVTNETHIRLAVGLDYRGASPVSGMRIGGGEEGMATSVIVNQNGGQLLQHQKVSTATLLQQAQQAQQ